MEEIKFESLTALYERLLPAFNTKCNELKSKSIFVTELDLWNYLKDTKWSNNKELSMASIVDDIFSVEPNDLMNYLRKEGEISDN